MDEDLRIVLQTELEYDLKQVQDTIQRLQQNVDRNPIKIKLDVDKNIQTQLQGIQKQMEGFKSTASGLLIPNNIDYTPIKQGTAAIKQQGEAIKASASATNTYSENISRAGHQIQSADKHTRSWGISLSRIIQYYVSFQMTIGLLRQSINTLKDMDDSLTQLSKVTKITREEFQQLGIEALEFASNYGRAVTDALDAQVTFARAGFENYQQMAELSLVAQSAGDMNEQLASSYLIASDKAYNYGGSVERLTALLDAQNQVSNRHAISMEFLAEATQNAGNAMRLAGETEQTMTAALTAIGVATQKSGSEVGRAARTIEMRIQQVKQAFKGLDTEVDGEIINAAEMSNAAKALEEIGIQVIKVEDGVEKFATMTEIAIQLRQALDEGTISATEMNKIVDALAGKHRAEYFLALVNNIDEYNRALENYANSAGSAMEEAMKQAVSWEGRINALKNTWAEFIAKTVDSQWIVSLVDALSFLIKSFDNLGTALGIVTAAFITLKLPALIPWFQTLQLQIKLLSMEVKSAGGFFNLLKMAFNGTAASAGTAAAAVTALQIAVGAAVAIISIGVMAWNNYNQTIAENNRLIAERAQKAKEEANTLSELISKYTELKGAENQDEGTRTQIRSIQEQITNLVGQQADNLDLVNGKLDTELEKLRDIELQNAKNTAKELEAAKIVAEAQADKGMSAKGAPSMFPTVSFGATSVEKALMATGLNEKYPWGGDILPTIHLFGKSAEEIIPVLQEWRDAFVTLGADGADALGYVNRSLDFYEEKANAAASAAKSFYEVSAKIDVLESLKTTTVNTQEAFNAFIDGIRLSTAYSEDYKQYLVEYANSLFPQFSQAVDETTNSLNVYRKSLSSMKDILSTTQSAYTALSSAQQDMDDSNGLSAETIQKLAAVTDDYMDYLIEENGQLELNTIAWKNMADAKMLAEMTKISLETDSLRAEREEIEENIRSLEQGIDDLMDAFAAYGDDPSIRDGVAQNEAAIQSAEQSIDSIDGKIADNQELLSKYQLIFDSLQSVDLSNVVYGLDAIALATEGITSVLSAIDDYSSKMSTLVDINEALANSFTLTLAQARDFAAVYPEILNGATVTADGQIVLNEAVANSFIEAKRAEINAEIDADVAKLEATKMELTAKKASAEAQLELANAVAEGEVDIENAKVQLLADAEQVLTQYLIDLGVSEVDASLAAAEAKAGNMEEYARIVGNVADDNANNLANSMAAAASATQSNVVNMVSSLDALGRQAANVASQIANIGTGTQTYNGRVSVGGGSAGGTGFSASYGNYNFSGVNGSTADVFNAALGEWKKNLELDISGYTSATAQIDGQIAALQALKNLPLSSYKGGLGGGGSGSGGGGSAKEVEEYIATINKLYAAEERLKDIQEQRAYAQAHIDTSGKTMKQIEYMKEIISLYEQEQDALHEINELRRDQISYNVEQLRDIGFDVDWDAETNHLFIRNMEQINNLQGSTTEKTNELRKAYEDLITSTISLNDANRSNSQSWWDVQKSILDTREQIYELWKATKDTDVSILERRLSDNFGDVNKLDIVRSWSVILDGVNAEIKYWTDLGYDYASDKIKALTQDLWDAQDAIKDVLDSIVSEANESLDSIQNVYDTLKNAAKEFAENQYITVDTFQQIAELGVEYLAYLRDENGQLVINEQAVQNVIAAKTQQVAVESALNYIRAIEAAMAPGKEKELERLLYATEAATQSTWGLVYANLELLGLEDSQYQAAKARIDALRSLADTAVTSIGKINGSLTDSLKLQQESLDNLLKYVIEMIKWEVKNQIDGLKSQVEQYRNMVNLQKESLRLAKEKDSYEKSVAKKVKDIAALQAKIDQLALDDSREAQAERRKLEEQLADLQEGLTDTQADYAYNTQVVTLDRIADAFEDEKNQEIKVLEDTISSYQKLYDLAILRIESQWGSLYSQLTEWNYNYGNVTTDTITSAWDTASLAVQRYGSYLEAVMQTQSQLASLSGNMGGDYSSPNVVGNSTSYGTDTKAARAAEVDRLMAQLRNMGAQWHEAGARGDKTTQDRLAAEGYSIGKEIGYYLQRFVDRGTDGVWYLDRIGGEKMFDVYDSGGANALFKYHTGGIAGDMPTPKDNEVYTLLEKGEAILDDDKKEAAYEAIDFASYMMAKAGNAIGDIAPPIPSGGLFDIAKNAQDATARNANIITTNNNIELNVDVHVDKDTDTSAARRIGRDVGDGALERLRDASTRRGVNTLSGSTLKQ